MAAVLALEYVKTAAGSLYRWGRGGGGSDPAPTGFTLGVTEPTAANTGTVASGRMQSGRAVVSSDFTAAANTTYYDTQYDGIVTLSSGCKFVNCVFRGPAAYTVTTTLIKSQANHAVRPILEFCDIIPRTPSAYVTGVGSKFYHLHRCFIDQTIDAFAAYSTLSDGLANVLIEGCYVPQMVRFAPDYANGDREEVHADDLQARGNNAPGVGASDIILRGNSFNARWHPTLGQRGTALSNVSNLACVMLSLDAALQSTYNLTIDQNWLRGGNATINGGDWQGSGSLVITNNRFERPGSATDAPRFSMLLAPASEPYRTVSGNTYIDNGAAVPVSNG